MAQILGWLSAIWRSAPRWIAGDNTLPKDRKNKSHRIARRVPIPDLRPPPNILDKVPSELLIQIFMGCLDLSFPLYSKLYAPSVLCRVNRRFRKICIGYSALWTDITVACSEHSPLVHPDFLKFCLRCSNNAPLSLTFHVTSHTPDGRAPKRRFARGVCRLLELVNEEFSRWESLDLLLFRPFDRVFYVPSSSLPRMLQHVKIYYPTLPGDDPMTIQELDERIGPLFRNLQHPLKTLAWQYRRVEHFPFPMAFHLPMHQLQYLHLDSVMVAHDLYVCLSLSPLLETLWVGHVCSESSTPYQSYPPLTRLHLRSLRVEATVSILDQFRAFTFPELASLSIVAWAPAASALGRASCELPGLLRRSKAPLQELVLHNLQVKEEELIDCLRASPALIALLIQEEAKLQPPRLTDLLINALGNKLARKETDDDDDNDDREREGATESRSRFITPRLESMVLMACVSSTDGNFSRMLRQRWGENAQLNSLACLKTVYAQFDESDLHPIDSSELRDLRREGLPVQGFW